MRRLAASLALCLAAAKAQALTGNELLQLMQRRDDPSSAVVAAYIRGFADASALAMRVTTEGAKVNGRFFCEPPGATIEQMRDLVQAELVAQPAERHRAAGAFVYLALHRAWPCAAD